MSCASTVSQHAALTALRGPQDIVGVMVDAYRERRDAAIAELDAAGVPSVRPGGSFFLMADIRASGMGSWAFAQRAAGGAPVSRSCPGAAFGPAGDGYVRISLAVAPGRGHRGRSPAGRLRPRAPHRMSTLTVDRGVTVTMPDGIRLAADVFRPAGPGRHPVVLLRTPYDRGNAAAFGLQLNALALGVRGVSSR